jgi:hypothetical protein
MGTYALPPIVAHTWLFIIPANRSAVKMDGWFGEKFTTLVYTKLNICAKSATFLRRGLRPFWNDHFLDW